MASRMTPPPPTIAHQGEEALDPNHRQKHLQETPEAEDALPPAPLPLEAAEEEVAEGPDGPR